MVQIRLFGEVGASSDDGQPIDVGPAKCQIVLAALAMSAGNAVPVSRLIELVWGQDPPRTADKTLQSYVTRLRKGLGPDAIDRVGVAYRLNVAPDAVDIARFTGHIDRGDVDSALSEWAGDPLAGLATDGFSATVDGLTEQWLGAVESDLERRLDDDGIRAGETSPIIGTLTELTARYPFREGLWALLMTGLYRAGRQADALGAYRTAREHLIEQLGVEPGPRLRELEASILGHDEQLPVDRSSGSPSAGTPTGTVTFGFCEVDDAARLWAAHRATMSDAMDRSDQLVQAIAADADGFVFATGGDAIGVAFHRAADALRWADGLQAAAEVEPWPGGIALRLRVGLHTGETEERSKGYFGPAVTIAGRLAAAGHGGQTLLSAVTATLSGDGDLRELGSFRLQGVVDPLRIMQRGQDAHPPLRTEDGKRGNLPSPAGTLFGRGDVLSAIDDALDVSKFVTLVGPGGIGKTRLALAAGRQWEVATGGGAWFIELASTSSPQEVSRTVADALGVPEQPRRSLTESVVNMLASRRALLILDNCEHVVDGAVELVKAVAAGAPETVILVTSREGLGIEREQLIAVPPLDPTDAAIELFNERAAAASQVFDGVGDHPHVAEICRKLDGVPLAIELAAARVRSLSPADLVDRLDDRLRLLSGGRRGNVERHRTLRATIQWSYDLLTPPERLLFQRLSIFAGPFDLQAAETVAADEVAANGLPSAGEDGRSNADAGGAGSGLDAVDVDHLLGSLVDRSMVTVESGQFTRRFRMLETMRQFGAEHLLAAGQTDRAAARHAQWCLERVTAVRGLLEGQAEIEGVARLGELWRNLRAAFEWACDTGDHRLAHELIKPIAAEVYLRSQTEIGDWAERLLSVTPEDDDEVVRFGIIWAARRYMRTMDRAGFDRLIECHGEPDDPLLRYAKAFIGSDREAMLHEARQALEILQQSGDRYGAALIEVAALDYSLTLNGRFDEIDERCADQIERFRRDGPPTCLNWATTMYGFAAALRGDHERSWQLFAESAEVAVPERTHSMRNPLAARVAFSNGKPRQALRRLSAYMDDLLENDNLYLTGLACIEFVDMMAKCGRPDEGATVLGFLGSAVMLEQGFFDAILADARHAIAEQSARVGAGQHGAAQVEAAQSDGGTMNSRQVLAFMRETLDRLADDAQLEVV